MNALHCHAWCPVDCNMIQYPVLEILVGFSRLLFELTLNWLGTRLV